MAARLPADPCNGSHESGDRRPRFHIREQDMYLPIANISRIMRKVIPRNGKSTQAAKETMQECVTDFIGFITSEASDMCMREKRMTINGDDILRAMATVGFDDYLEPLRLYLQKYREIEGDGKGSAKEAESSDKRDEGGFQGGNLSDPSMQADMKRSVCPNTEFPKAAD